MRSIRLTCHRRRLEARYNTLSNDCQKDNSACIGYIQGVLDAFIVAQAWSARISAMSVHRKKLPINNLADIVYQYLHTHPQGHHDNAASEVINAHSPSLCPACSRWLDC